MEWSEIEVKGVSCRDLALPLALFGSAPVYAVVSLGDGTGKPGRNQSQSTQFDRTGGRNPEWDHHMRFDLAKQGSSSSGAPFLEFDFVVRSGTGGILGDRVVGETRIPVRELAEEYSGYPFRYASYQIRCPNGKAAGVLSFFYRVGPKHQDQDVKLPPPPLSAPKEKPLSGRRLSTVCYPVIDDPPSRHAAVGDDAPPLTYPVISASDFCPSPPFPPFAATNGEYFPLPPPATVHVAPLTSPSPPSDTYGLPTVGYCFEGRRLPRAHTLAPAAPDTYGYPSKSYDLAVVAGEAWRVDGGSCADVRMYGEIPHETTK